MTRQNNHGVTRIQGVTRLNKILAGLLAVQVVLALVMLTRDRGAGVAPLEPLTAGLDAAKVTKVQVFAKRDKTATGKASDAKPDVELAKKGTAWVVASGYDYPVDAAKVTKLLGDLSGLKVRGAIATGTARHVQLGVADDVYERKLVVTTDQGDRVFYIGAAAGGQRTAVRLGKDSRVYAVPTRELSAFSVDAEAKGWVDRTYLEIGNDDVASVTVTTAKGTVELDHATGTWVPRIAGATVTPAAGEVLDTAAIDAVIGKLTRLELAAPGDPARPVATPTATITVRGKPPAASGDAGAVSAAAAEHVLDVVADGDRYWVHERGNPRAVFVEKFALDSVVELGRDKLVKKAPPPAPAGAGAAGAGAPQLPPGMPDMELPGPG